MTYGGVSPGDAEAEMVTRATDHIQGNIEGPSASRRMSLGAANKAYISKLAVVNEYYPRYSIATGLSRDVDDKRSSIKNAVSSGVSSQVILLTVSSRSNVSNKLGAGGDQAESPDRPLIRKALKED